MAHGLDILRETLTQYPIVLIDAGARNGTFELPGLAAFAHVYGFEPNPVEYEKLCSGKTDVYQASRVVPPRYARMEICPAALGHAEGRQRLYVTKGPGACSLMEPNRAVTDQYDRNWSWNFEVTGTEEVECATLETVMRRYGLECVDYIKLDTQGNEFEILFASPAALQKISVIKTEVEFVETYKGQRLFPEFDTALRQAGFHFIDLVVGPDHRKGRNILAQPRGQGEMLWADAFYARRLSDDERQAAPQGALKQALALLELGYLEYGVHLLQQVGPPYNALQERIEAHYTTTRKTFKQMIPAPLKTAARKMYRSVCR